MNVPGTAPAAALPRLSWGSRLTLVAEVLRTYVTVVRGPWRHDIRTAVTELRAAPGPTEIADPSTTTVLGTRLGYAVSRTLPLLPTESRCLIRSLVLTSMLARRGIESSLVIGVRSEPSFMAHAWVEHEGQALLPPRGTAFTRLHEL